MADTDWDKKQLVTLAVRPPWHPSAEDAGFVRDMTTPELASRERPNILVLGMTRQLVQHDWPPGASVTAIDASPSIVASVWQPHPVLPSRAVCAPWQDTPFEDGEFDLVAGDGSLNSLAALDDYPRVLAETARILAPRQCFVMRCFVRPEIIESPDDVLARARDGAFPTTAAFRFRFCLALAAGDGGVALSDLYAAFSRLVPDRDDLARATGWPRADIDRVDVDAASKVRFTFPTQAQFAEVCAPHFRIERMARGTYTQSEQCPTILFRRTRS